MHFTPQQILLAGATGLVGEHLLDRLLNEPTITRVLAPTRRPLMTHPHLDNPVAPDLLAALDNASLGIDTAFCCLGTTMATAGSKKAFRAVDHDLVITFATRARELGSRHLLVVSAIGADSQSSIFYNRVKGEAEQALRDQQWPQLTIVRPSLLLGHRRDRRITESLAGPILKHVPGKWGAIEATSLARALWRLALEDGNGTRVIECDKLRQLGR